MSNRTGAEWGETRTKTHPDTRHKVAKNTLDNLSSPLLVEGREGLADGGDLLQVYAYTHARGGKSNIGSNEDLSSYPSAAPLTRHS